MHGPSMDRQFATGLRTIACRGFAIGGLATAVVTGLAWLVSRWL